MNEKNIKNIAGKFLVLTFLLFGFFYFVSAENCTDSDGGLNYYVKGTVLNSPPEFRNSWTDTCLTDTRLQEGTCIEDLGIHTFECPNGCVDGACASNNIDKVAVEGMRQKPAAILNATLSYEQVVSIYELFPQISKLDVPYTQVEFRIYLDDFVPDRLALAFIIDSSAFGEYNLEILAPIEQEIIVQENDYVSLDGIGLFSIVNQDQNGAVLAVVIDRKIFTETDLSTYIKNRQQIFERGVKIYNNGLENPSDEIKENLSICESIGLRKSGKFCSDDGSFIEQQEKDSVCENNFECESNVCISGKCIDEGFIQKVISWFTRLFTRN